MNKAELLAMLMKLQSYVIDNGGIDEDVAHVIDNKIEKIKEKLVEGNQ
jgi:nucleoid DNA-binding protein